MTEIEILREACEYAARHSDDPRTRVGAAVWKTGHDIVYAANSLPRGVYRDPLRLEPPAKYRFVEHAERGALFKAASLGVPTGGAVLYSPWFSCTDCARGIICAGIREVVGLARLRQATPERWEEEIATAEQMLREAGVGMRWFADPVLARVRFDDRDIMV